MNIPRFEKNADADRDACLALSLLMAMHALGQTDVSKNQIYRKAECVGEGNLALPWGICKAADEFGFSITHGSKNPYSLVDYGELKEKGRLDDAGARFFVDRLVKYCKDRHETINLVKYPAMNGTTFQGLMNGYLQFMKHIVENELGVAFVTLKWTSTENHTLPIKKFTLNEVVLVNCNQGQVNEPRYGRSEFEEKWNDRVTDNDFFILWKPDN